MHLVLTRRRILFAIVAVILLVAFCVWRFDADRQLDRRWRELLATVEARNPSRLRGILAEDYQDRWGYDRATILAESQLAFRHFEEITLRPGDVSVARRGDRATITATLRLEARGSELAARARTAVNAIYSPYVFEWRREPGLFAEWTLVRFDQPELDLRGFRRGVF